MNGGTRTDLKLLKETPPWEWPKDAGTAVLAILRDDSAEESDRRLAAEMAGDCTVINDDLAEALLTIVASAAATVELRSVAAISLGPALEHADTIGFEDADAVRFACDSRDQGWRRTGAICMRFVGGFDDEIHEALGSDDAEVHYRAVCAAGNWEVDAAWSHTADLVVSDDTDKSPRLAAIEALAGIRPQQAVEVLVDLTDLDDDDIVDAAYEALAVARGLSEEDLDESLL